MIILSCSLFATRHFDSVFFLARFISLARVTVDDKITFNFQVLVKMPRDNHRKNTAKTPCLDFIIGSFQSTDIKNLNSYEM